MIGSVFKGYSIIKELGKGGFGAVYYGRKIDGNPSDDNFHVAIKILLSLHCKDEVMVKRFHREAKLAKRLSHPNVVAILDHGEENNIHYIIMEYAVGKTMLQYLRDMTLPNADEIKIELSSSEENTISLMAVDQESEDKKVQEDITQTINFKADTEINTPLHLAIPLMKQCAAVLQAAYELGMIHRDLKPENILLRKDKRGKVQVKILDFGLAKNFVDESMQLSIDGQIFGTPSYMSPEQYRGKKLDIRSDLYSLGASFYTFITNEKPFKGPKIKDYMKQILELPHKSACEVNQKVPKSLSAIIDKLLEKERDKRYAVPEELMEDLNRSLRGDALLNAENKAGHYAKAIFISIVLLCLFVIGGFCFFKFYYFPEQNKQEKQVLNLLDKSLDKIVESEHEIQLHKKKITIEEIKEESKLIKNDSPLLNLEKQDREKKVIREDSKEIIKKDSISKDKINKILDKKVIITKESNQEIKNNSLVKENHFSKQNNSILSAKTKKSNEDDKSEDIQTISTPSLDETDIKEESEDPEEVVGFTKAFTKGKIATSAKDRFKLLNQ